MLSGDRSWGRRVDYQLPLGPSKENRVTFPQRHSFDTHFRGHFIQPPAFEQISPVLCLRGSGWFLLYSLIRGAVSGAGASSLFPLSQAECSLPNLNSSCWVILGIRDICTNPNIAAQTQAQRDVKWEPQRKLNK